MSSKLQDRALLSLSFGLVLIAATSCGQSAGLTPAGPSATAMESETVQAAAGQRPVVSGVRITSATAQSGRARYTLAATVTDANGDVVGGRLRLRVVSTGQVLVRPITASVSEEVEREEAITVAAATLEAATLRGTQLSATFSLSPTPTSSARLAVSAQDRAGNRSAEISFTAPVPSGGRGSGLNAQEAAQVRRDVASLVASLVGQVRAEQTQSAATFSTTASLPCPAGGNASASVTITANVTQSAIEVNGNGNARLNGCRLGGGLEARGAVAFSFVGQCPPSITVTVRGRIQVFKNGGLADDTFDIDQRTSAQC